MKHLQIGIILHQKRLFNFFVSLFFVDVGFFPNLALLPKKPNRWFELTLGCDETTTAPNDLASPALM